MKGNYRLLVIGIALLFCLGCAIPTFALTGSEKPQSEQPLVTATFFDSDLRESLKEIALQCKVNIVTDENVRGLVTLELKDVPLEKALRMMLFGGGYSFRKIDDFYVVGLADPKNPAFAGLCDTEVFYFENISAESARSLLPNFYEPYVKFDAGKDSATIIAPPELLAKITADLKKMDGKKCQIMIKALVTEVQNQVLKEWGMDSLNVDLNPTKVGARTLGVNIPNGLISGSGDGNFGHFEATIKAMVNEKKAIVHADPTLIVNEGKTGELFVGEKRTLILQSQGTNASTSSTENVEAGTSLKVTPRLLGDQIELTFSQKVSGFEDEYRTDQILVRSREFNSVIRFAPGQTVMVAGLTEKKTSNGTLKTPILGDIPLIGLLFKQKSDSKDESQLLIFLTAEVIK
jgi:type II secretory pathway component HofQ